MSRFALTWIAEDRPNVLELDPGRDYVIGRDPGADVVLPQRTVSRKHAILRGEASRFLIEDRAPTNPTTVDGSPLSGSRPLADGAEVDAGGQRLRFWDLASGDQISGPVCSHCGRENTSSEGDCWFCGTSLVNAPTGIRTRRQVLLRLIDPDGTPIDLVDQRELMFRSDGTYEPVGSKASASDARITVVDGRPALRGSAATVEGPEPQPAGEDGRVLSTGDLVRIGDRRYVAIVR